MSGRRWTFIPGDKYHWTITYRFRRLRRRLRWWIARHVIREELEAVADPYRQSTATAKLGGDFLLARGILGGWMRYPSDEMRQAQMDAEFLTDRPSTKGTPEA